ncbi:50S ribosomal protein L10 [Patescibacteria group bacterium]|nr:50S ribosomal protein L10 [Patescibacteria group bacterium]
MAKTIQQKAGIIKELEDKLNKTKNFVLIDYYGIKANDINNLRQLLKNSSCEYLVTKKTLLQKAIKRIGLDVNLKEINGGFGIILNNEDEIEPARAAINLSKKYKSLNIHGGVFNSELVDVAKIKELASIPTKEILLSQLANIIQAPVRGFASVLNGNMRNLVYVLSSIKN